METGVEARILVGFLSDVRIPVIRICDLFSKASNYFAGCSFFRTGTSSISRESVHCGIEGGREHPVYSFARVALCVALGNLLQTQNSCVQTRGI